MTEEKKRLWLKSKERYGETADETLMRLNDYINELFVFEEYGQMYEASKEKYRLMKMKFGADDLPTIASINDAGVALYYMKQYDKAMILLGYVLELRTRSLGRFHKGRLLALKNMRNVINAQFTWNKMPELLRIEKELCLVSEKLLGRDSKETIDCLNRYVTDLCSDGRHTEAFDYAKEAFDVSYMKYGMSDILARKAAGNMAEVLKKIRPAEKTLLFHKRLLDVYEDEYGNGDERTLDLMLDYCRGLFESDTVLKSAVNKTRAITCAERYLNTCLTRRGPEHDRTYAAAEILVNGLERVGNIKAAAGHQQRMCDQIIENDNSSPRMGECMARLIELKIKAGDADQAGIMAAKVLPVLCGDLKANEKTILHIRAMLARL